MRIMTPAAPGYSPHEALRIMLRLRRCLAATVLLFTPWLLSAQTFDQVCERAQGMGGALVAVADEASAIYWTPAGLAHVYEFDAQLSVSRTTLLGLAMPAVAAGYYRNQTAVSSSGSRKNGRSGEV